MRLLDASSIIYAWDNYPPEQFPKLWEWIALEITEEVLVIAQVALQEVRLKTPECGDWLNDHTIDSISPGNAILHLAIDIQQTLGVSGSHYHPKGVGENDIIIIATAKHCECELITNENIQNNLPQELIKYKIPAVCDLTNVDVQHLDFLQYLKQSRQVFG